MWIVNKILIGVFLGYLTCATGKWLIINVFIKRKVDKKMDVHLRKVISNCKSIDELWSVEAVLERHGYIDG